MHAHKFGVYNMKKRSRYVEREYVDRRLLLHLGLYFIVMLVTLAVVLVEVLNGSFAPVTALVCVAVGLVIGVVLTRRFHLSLDERTDTVVGTTDVIGAIILACYVVFVLTKPDIFGSYEQGLRLLVALVAISAGTQLGRIIGMGLGIRRLERELFGKWQADDQGPGAQAPATTTPAQTKPAAVPPQIPKPQLVAPRDNAVFQVNQYIMFKWKAVPGAVSYVLEFNKSTPGTQNHIVWTPQFTITPRTTNPQVRFTDPMLLRWRVTAISSNPSLNSDPSSWCHFTTK